MSRGVMMIALGSRGDALCTTYLLSCLTIDSQHLYMGYGSSQLDILILVCSSARSGCKGAGKMVRAAPRHLDPRQYRWPYPPVNIDWVWLPGYGASLRHTPLYQFGPEVPKPQAPAQSVTADAKHTVVDSAIVFLYANSTLPINATRSSIAAS